MIQVPLKKPATLYAQVTGLNGKVRELRAVINPAATCSLISYKDGFELGYPITYEPMTGIGERLTIATPNGIVETSILSLEEVKIGELVAKKVKAGLQDLPEQSGVDLVLGASFLENFTVTFDYKKGMLTIVG